MFSYDRWAEYQACAQERDHFPYAAAINRPPETRDPVDNDTIFFARRRQIFKASRHDDNAMPELDERLSDRFCGGGSAAANWRIFVVNDQNTHQPDFTRQI